jgi:hypothetical protein
MAVLRSHVDEARRRASTHQRQGEQRFFRTYHPAGASVLVEVLLWEGHLDGAWDEAQGGGCPHRLWMRLALTRERTDPLAAIAIYRREVEQLLGLNTKRAHAQAVHVIEHIGDLYSQLASSSTITRKDTPR